MNTVKGKSGRLLDFVDFRRLLIGKFPEKSKNRPDPTFTPHLSRNSNKLQSRIWIRTISRFLLIFIGSPSANFLKSCEIDWIQPLLRLFSEQACARLSSPWRDLCPYTHYMVFESKFGMFVQVCARLHRCGKYAQIQKVRGALASLRMFAKVWS